MRRRNSQGLRDVAPLNVPGSQMTWGIQPMRTRWAKPLAITLGRSGVDVLLVICGFIIYHLTGRSAAQVVIVGRAWASYEFARKRIGLLRRHVLRRPLHRISLADPDAPSPRTGRLACASQRTESL